MGFFPKSVFNEVLDWSAADITTVLYKILLHIGAFRKMI